MSDGLTIGLRNLGGFAGFLWGIAIAASDAEMHWVAGGCAGALFGLIAGQVAGVALNIALKLTILALFIGLCLLRVVNIIDYIGG